jgi:uridine kinase
MTGRPQIESAVERIVTVREDAPAARSVSVAVSGIDGSGKGYVAARMVEALVGGGLRVAALNLDGWLNLPHVRFLAAKPAEHFYDLASREPAWGNTAGPGTI